jgi:Flp pilus assembly protein TadB
MAKRNMIWLAVVIAAGVLGWLAVNIVVGLLAAVIVLAISEVVERRARARRRAARDQT